MKQTIPFTFEEIYKDLEKEFAKLGYDTPFEGSNTAQIITAMAYTISNLNLNTAVNINENLLTLARKRKNILQDARILGYEASKKISYKYKIELKFKQLGKFIIPKYSVFTSGDKKYYYLGSDKTIEIRNIDEMNSLTLQLEIKEGNLITYKEKPNELIYTFNGIQNYIDIPYTDVEDDGIEIYATYYDPIRGKIEKEEWNKSKILLLDKNDQLHKEFLRLDVTDTNTPRCYFAYSGIGHELPAGAILEVNALISSGSQGSLQGLLQIDGYIQEFCKLNDAFQPQLLVTGLEEESDQSIKDNAPLMNNTASRVVTAFDYKAVANNHASVKDCIVWGGEDEVPVRKGNIYCSFLPEKISRKFSIYSKVSGTEIFEGINDKSTVSERYIYKLDDSINKEKNYISNSELLSQSINENKTILNPGVWDNLDKFKLPALYDNLRNPIYVFVDFYIDVKKYKLGIAQSEIRQKIFDKLNEKIQRLETFDTTFFNSNIIKQLDNELSDIMGLTLKPKFYILIDSENTAKKRMKSITSSNLRAYIDLASNNQSAKLNVWLPLNGFEGDTINVEYNKTIVYKDGSYTSKDTIKATNTDVANRLISKTYDISNLNQSGGVNVLFNSRDKTINLKGTDLQYYNIENKRLYYYSKINGYTSQIQILLPKFVKPGDKIKVTAHYGKTDTEETSIVSDYTINKNDKFSNRVDILDRFHGSYAGIVYPLRYTIEYSNEFGNKLSGEECANLEIAKQKTDSQNQVFNGLSLSELFYDSYTDELSEHVEVWLPSAIAKENDILIVQSKLNPKNRVSIDLTKEQINKKKIEVSLPLEKLSVLNYSYTSVKGENINIYPLYYKDAHINTIEEISDDSLDFASKQIEIKKEYIPTNTGTGVETFKDNYTIELFANAINKFDIRNLIINRNDNTPLSALIPSGSELAKQGVKFEYPYLIWEYPPKNTKTKVLTINLDGKTKDYILSVKSLSTSSIDATDEGEGGIYIYLDLPFEDLYTNKKLNIDVLPKIETLNYIESKKIYVDTTINAKTIKSIFPYIITEDQLDTLNWQALEYISFPVKIDDEVVGTYTIFNERIPYIRIKLKRNVSSPDESRYLNLKYPTDNIHFIRNSFLRLRNVYFENNLRDN